MKQVQRHWDWQLGIRNDGKTLLFTNLVKNATNSKLDPVGCGCTWLLEMLEILIININIGIDKNVPSI